MQKTTTRVPRQPKAARNLAARSTPPAPRLPLFHSNKPWLAERIAYQLEPFSFRAQRIGKRKRFRLLPADQ